MSLEIDCQLQRDKFNLEVHLTVAPGSVLAITGENGSGKTSTLDMIAGLLACTTGKISLNDRVFDDSTTNQFVQPEKRGVSTVFQGGGLFSHMTVEKNMIFGRGAAFRFDSAVEQFNLTGLLSRKPSTLSGGQRQRVALARAFLAPSEILLLDEPTTSLDTTSRDEVRSAMKTFFETYNGVVVLVSHDAAEIAELATSVAQITISRGENTAAILRN
ncbi:MAG: ATP-binding cassette domain-containing protein [Actinomycetota bacterium]|nr:ATP-binding cassette domain-containing protein [Actinomycetota bacterium]